jgi:hypothetical protein
MLIINKTNNINNIKGNITLIKEFLIYIRIIY